MIVCVAGIGVGEGEFVGELVAVKVGETVTIGDAVGEPVIIGDGEFVIVEVGELVFSGEGDGEDELLWNSAGPSTAPTAMTTINKTAIIAIINRVFIDLILFFWKRQPATAYKSW
jgi:hypothetical protein